MAVGDISVNIL